MAKHIKVRSRKPYFQAVHGDYIYEGTLEQLAEEFGTNPRNLYRTRYNLQMRSPRGSRTTPFKYKGITIKEIGKIRYRSLYLMENAGTVKRCHKKGTKEEIAHILGVTPGTLMSHVNGKCTFVRSGRHYIVTKTDEVRKYVCFYDKRQPKIWTDKVVLRTKRK